MLYQERSIKICLWLAIVLDQTRKKHGKNKLATSSSITMLELLCENDEISFIDYMIAKGDAHYLERQPDWLKEIVPNTTVRRDYGIHRSSEKIRDFLHGCLKKYTEEAVHVEKDDDGNIVSEIKGMSKIFDPVLIRRNDPI
jgi:hypothetical protein